MTELRPTWRKLVGTVLGRSQGNEVLSTGYTEEQVENTVDELDGDREDLEIKVQSKTRELRQLVRDARNSTGQEKENLLDRIHRLRSEIDALEARLEDVRDDLTTWREILGTHEMKEILEESQEHEADLSDVDPDDVEHQMEQVRTRREKRHKQNKKLRRKARNSRETETSVDRSRERQVVEELSYDEERGQDGDLDSLDEEIRELEKEVSDE